MILNKKDRKLVFPLPPWSGLQPVCVLLSGWYWTRRTESCSFRYPLIWSSVCFIFQDDIEQEGQKAVPSATPWSGLQFVLFSRMILNKKDRKLFLPLPPDLVFSFFIFQDDIEQEGQKAVPSATPWSGLQFVLFSRMILNKDRKLFLPLSPWSGLQPMFYFPGWYWTRRTESCSFRYPLIWSSVCFIFQDDIEQEGQEAVPSVTPRSGLQFVLFSRMILNKKDRKLFLPLPPDLVFSLFYFPGWYWTRRTESCSFCYPLIWSAACVLFSRMILNKKDRKLFLPLPPDLVFSLFYFPGWYWTGWYWTRRTESCSFRYPLIWSSVFLFSRMILNKKDKKLFLPLPPDLVFSLFYFPGWYWTRRTESCSFRYPPDLVFNLCFIFQDDIEQEGQKAVPSATPWSGLQFVLFSRMILNKKDRKLFLPLPPDLVFSLFYFPGWYWTRRTGSCSFRYLPIWSSVCSIFQDDIEQEGQKAVPSVTPWSGLQPVFYFPGWYWTRRTESCSFRYPPIWSSVCFIFQDDIEQDDIEQEGQKAVPSATPWSGLQFFYFPGWYWTRRTKSCSFRYPLIWSSVCFIFQDDIEQEGQKAVPSVIPLIWSSTYVLFSRMILNKEDRKLFLPLPPDLVFSLFYFPGWYWTRRTGSCSFRYPPIWSSVCFIFQDDIEQEGQEAVPSVTSRSGLQFVLFSRMILNKKDRKLFLLLPPDLVCSLCSIFQDDIEQEGQEAVPSVTPRSGLQFVLFSRMILNKKDRKLFLPSPPLPPIWYAACVCFIFQDDIKQEGQKAVPSVTPWSGLQPVFYFPGWYWTRRTESCSFRYPPDLVFNLCSIFQDDIEQEGQKAVPSVTPHPTPQSGLQPVFYFPGWYWTRRTESWRRGPGSTSTSSSWESLRLCARCSACPGCALPPCVRSHTSRPSAWWVEPTHPERSPNCWESSSREWPTSPSAC